MRALGFFLALGLLGACGAEGPPEAPAASKVAAQGLIATGEITFGLGKNGTK